MSMPRTGYNHTSRQAFLESFGPGKIVRETVVMPEALSAEDAALLALTAEIAFNDRHRERLPKIPDLRELAASYFESYFEQIAAGEKPKPDSILEQSIADACGGTRSGNYFLQDMGAIAKNMLDAHQKTGQHHVRSR